ncbi:MAG TPA: hypothetical protein V6C69_20555 [Trichormus sp.]
MFGLTFDKISTEWQIAIGIFLLLLGVSFTYKAFLAIIKGKMSYWEGFLPFTMLSPFTVHLPGSKNSLIKSTEGLWIHLIMGPVFMITAILFLGAGADLAGLPGTATANWVLSGGRNDQQITFDRRTGFRFPIIARVGPQLAKLFGKKIDLGEKDLLYKDNGSLNDALEQGK